MNYLDYWKLKDKPFEGTRNTRFFFPGENHVEALERLLYIIRDRNMNFGLLTGDIGSGKTIIKTILEHHLLKEDFEVVSIENACFPFHPTLIEIVSQLKNQKVDIKENDEYAAMNILKELLVKIVIENNRHLVILLDEAHQLDKACLDKIKNLTNICSEDENYITIILIGQPELKALIRSLPQLDQRVSLRYHLKYLPPQEVKGYIDHRLKVAGGPKNEIFSDGVVNLIYKSTNGIPREINRICRLALDSAFAVKERNVSEPIVKAIFKDINLQSSTADDLGKVDPLYKKIPKNETVVNSENFKKNQIPLLEGGSRGDVKSASKKILILDDSSPDNNPVFNMLIDHGYSVNLSKKENGCLTEVPEQTNLVVVKIDFKRGSDKTLFKRINALKNVNGVPLLIVAELPPLFKANKEKLEKLIELTGKRLLVFPFMAEELAEKIDTLLKMD